MASLWRAAPVLILLPFAGASLGTGACDADMTESCEDGSCTSTTSSSAGGASGFQCTIDKTHGLPCDVYDVIERNCQRCHFTGTMVAPHVLEDYDDTQEFYSQNASMVKTPKWTRMKRAIQKDGPIPHMPIDAWPMADADIDTMNAWFATCGRDDCLLDGMNPAAVCDKDLCAKGTGINEGGASASGGAGGAGGSGGAGGNGGQGGI